MRKFQRLGRFLAASLVLAFSGLLTAPANALSPSDTVKATVDAVLVALSDTTLDEQGKRAAVLDLVTHRFNFPAMSKRILAVNWKKASDPQREEFIALFTQILANTYWRRIKDYSDEAVRYTGEKIKGGTTARVNTIVVTDTNEIPIDYSLKKSGDEWFAYDVRIEGVSLVRNYAGSYQQIAKQEGIDGLLARMSEKVAAMQVQ